jgi:transglutaminase-like putative cysteine protease
MKYLFFAFLFLIPLAIFSQKIELSVLLIPDSLKLNANAVIRLDQMDIEIASQRSMNIKQKRIVTVLNEKGVSAIGAVESYDKRTTVRSIEATVYDAFGNEIKKIKRKDFRDQSAVDGISLFSDDRILYLDYTPTQYPFTIVYESEVASSDTAFLPRWYFLSRYFTSVEKCVLNVVFPNDLGFKKKAFNFSGFNIIKTTDSDTQLSYVASNLLPQKEESFSREAYHVFPWIMMGLEKFNLSGVDGNAKTWKEFGQWYADKILSETSELSEETIAKIKALVGAEKDALQKAKIIYNYIQQKSRYVSIQVGIGGWKPMLAKDVDRLGYGDCKALTNYTHALLKAVGVPSYHTLLYGDSHKKDIESDFVSVQGNHMILSIPYENDYVWLECTSQDAPFGYQANFTDDRNVLVVKPDGAEIVRTKNYQNQDNTQYSKGSYSLTEDGSLHGNISIVSEGSCYGFKYTLESKTPTDREEHYKEYWDNINNLKIIKTVFVNDRENIRFTENIEIESEKYATFSSNKILFVVNAFNQNDFNIKRIRNRKNAFEVQRGSYDADEITVILPQGFSIETMPKDVTYNSKFGEYKTEIIKKEDSNFVYKRTFLLKKGQYSNTEYEEFRLYLEQIARHDNAKIIAIKS